MQYERVHAAFANKIHRMNIAQSQRSIHHDVPGVPDALAIAPLKSQLSSCRISPIYNSFAASSPATTRARPARSSAREPAPVSVGDEGGGVVGLVGVDVSVVETVIAVGSGAELLVS